MAPVPENKKKETASKRKFLNKYLFLYNLIQFVGWLYVSYKFADFYANKTVRKENVKLWTYVYPSVALFQTLAVVEIIHVILGFVKTSVFVTTMQITFRLINTFGVFNLIPPHMDTIGVPMTLFAWCGAELARYSFHIFKEFNYLPYFITWIRYSAFIVLIPIGVSGELLGQYIVQSLYANKWTYFIPSLNFTIKYRYVLLVMMLGSAQGVTIMYKHLLAQRRKALGGASDDTGKTTHKSKLK